MAYDKRLAERAEQQLKHAAGLSQRKMFGGIGFMLHGNMCVGVWKNWLVVRFDKSEHEQTLAMDHVEPFDITGRVMRGWALVDQAALTSDADLAHWIDRSVRFVRRLPRK